MNTQTIKTEIKTSYGNIAKGIQQVGCCSTGQACCGAGPFDTTMSEAYTNVAGYHKEADLLLGCGLPTEIANIKPGQTVLDLGSGAGNDVFIARSLVGETGQVIGIDMTPEMVIRALQNNQKLGYRNVNFHLGEIENMSPIATNTNDVVISNCVMNLVPDKEKAFSEVHRVLKQGGHFSISDIVYIGTMPERIREAAELYAGCVAGASEKGEYLGIIKAAGFKNIQIKKERKIELPEELALQYLSAAEWKSYKKTNSGIYSITVYADKLEQGACCEANDAGCCVSQTNNSKEQSDTSSCCGANSISAVACCA